MGRSNKSDDNSGRELLTDVKQLVQQMFTSKDFLDKISEIVTQVISSTIDRRVQKLESDGVDLKGRITQMEKLMSTREAEVDAMDQRYRLNSLSFFGIPDSKKEDTNKTISDVLLSKFGNMLKIEDIYSGYRLGQFKQGSNRPILVKFSNLSARDRVFKNKSMLKGTEIVVRESLTPTRLRLVKESIGKYGARNVWTSKGEIFIKDNGRIRRLTGKGSQ